MEAIHKPIRSYRDLVVWQKAMDLVALSYRISRMLPKDERFGLAQQIERSAVSVPSNIAEGHGRRHRGDFVHHLSIANGSLKELETQLLVAVRLAYVQEKDIAPAMALAEEIGKMLMALHRKLQAR